MHHFKDMVVMDSGAGFIQSHRAVLTLHRYGGRPSLTINRSSLCPRCCELRLSDVLQLTAAAHYPFLGIRITSSMTLS